MKNTYMRVSENVESTDRGDDVPGAKTKRVSPLLLRAFELLDNTLVEPVTDGSGKLNHLATLNGKPLEHWAELVELGEFGFTGTGEMNKSKPISYNPPTWDRQSPFTEGFLHLQVTDSTGTFFVYGDRPKSNATEVYGLMVWLEEK